ncbi:MAG: hypothetical protein IJX74_06260 [Clostridia bacterium]|nr:hypothetical protein [Clostridia bacterium]
MKYQSVTEILEDKSLSLDKAWETVEKFLSEKGMTVDEFFYETEEGQKLQEKSAEARFTMPTN